MAETIATTVEMFYGERRIPYFDFTLVEEIVSGQTITGTPAITVVETVPDPGTTPAPLTIGAIAVDSTGKKVLVQVSDGSAFVTYTLKCVADLSDGFSRLEGFGKLRMDDGL